MPNQHRLCQWPGGCQRRVRANDVYCIIHGQVHHYAQEAPGPEVPATPKAEPRRKRARNMQVVADFPPTTSLDDFTDAVIEPLDLGPMDLRCEFCNALHFRDELVGAGRTRHMSLCCKNGKLRHVPALPDAPEPLRSLLLCGTRAGQHFRGHIRRYNAAMSFISFGANLEVLTGTERHRAPPVCIVHGAVYHHSPPLRANAPEEARFGQLYLYDAQEATALRRSRDPALSSDVLADLQDMLHRVQNPYIGAYRRMGELTEECGGARSVASRAV